MMVNREYIKSRDRLIPEAMDIANSSVFRNKCKNEDDYKHKWNVCFHQTMDRLCRERIHRKGNGADDEMSDM